MYIVPPRHKSEDVIADLEYLDTQIQRVILSSQAPILITGDVNCNLLASDADVCKRKFSEFLNGLCLHQFVNQPTHRSGSLLDVLVSNSASFVSNVNVAQCPYSDHCIISADLCIPKNRPKPTFISSRRLHRMNVLGFQDTLRVTDWSAVFSCTDVSGQWSAFCSNLQPILDFYAPMQRIKIRNPSAPPVSEATRDLMTQRRTVLAQQGRTPEFVLLNKRVRSAIRTDVKNDISRRIAEMGPTTIFRNVRQVIAGKKGTNVITPESTPDELNEYFIGVGPRVAAEVQARGAAPSLPCRLPRVGACAFSLLPITLRELRSFLRNMKNSGACGSDGICIKIIKMCFEAIDPVILHIIKTH